MSKIISARLSEKTMWKLEFLKSAMGNKKATEVLSEAIDHLYMFQSQKQYEKTAFDFLQDMGFIGAIEGTENDSVNYKQHAVKRMNAKI